MEETTSNEHRETRFIGTPKEINLIVERFFEYQRTYVKQQAQDKSADTQEVWMDAMERELWEVTLKPLDRRAAKQIRDSLTDVVGED